MSQERFKIYQVNIQNLTYQAGSNLKTQEVIILPKMTPAWKGSLLICIINKLPKIRNVRKSNGPNNDLFDSTYIYCYQILDYFLKWYNIYDLFNQKEPLLTKHGLYLGVCQQ